jgi:hypothetical protein
VLRVDSPVVVVMKVVVLSTGSSKYVGCSLDVVLRVDAEVVGELEVGSMVVVVLVVLYLGSSV